MPILEELSPFVTDSAGFHNSTELNNLRIADNLSLWLNVIPLYKSWMLFQYTESKRRKVKNQCIRLVAETKILTEMKY